MRIVVWHVHGGWMDAFVRGGHRYLLPTDPRRDVWGLGRGGRAWPGNAEEVAIDELRHAGPDIVVLQRPEERTLYTQATGRVPGTDLPALYLEHNTPPTPFQSVHTFAEAGMTIVHVTAFNRLVWDTGRARTRVIEHGIPDPGALYTGDMRALAVVSNDPVRRLRAVGTDLLPPFTALAPLHAYGMGTAQLTQELALPASRVTVLGDLPTQALHRSLARRRAYLHLTRWTSLGLSLLEAMFLGMPVLALATTEVPRSVPREAGAVSTDPAELMAAARILLNDPAEAAKRGRIAREVALARHSLDRFLAEWDDVLEEEVERFARRRRLRQPPQAHVATPEGHFA
jgi:hypothetical protein